MPTPFDPPSKGTGHDNIETKSPEKTEEEKQGEAEEDKAEEKYDVELGNGAYRGFARLRVSRKREQSKLADGFHPLFL